MKKLPDLFTAVTSQQPRAIERPPAELAEFRGLSLFNRQKEGSTFYNVPVIKDYLDKKWEAELHNRDSFLWIWDVYRFESDPIKKRAISNKLAQFRASIQRTDNPFRALALDFNKFEFQTEHDEVVEELNESI